MVGLNPVFRVSRHPCHRGPQGADFGAPDAGKKCDFFRHLLQGFKEFSIPNVTIAGTNRHKNEIGAWDLVLILEECLDIGVVCGHLFEETGIHSKVRCITSHDESEDCEGHQNRKTKFKKNELYKTHLTFPLNAAFVSQILFQRLFGAGNVPKGAAELVKHI